MDILASAEILSMSVSVAVQQQLSADGWYPVVRSFVITLDPSAETFMSVQCASPERGGKLVGVCGVCASCVGWRKG